jgi:hypothetical protein
MIEIGKVNCSEPKVTAKIEKQLSLEWNSEGEGALSCVALRVVRRIDQMFFVNNDVMTLDQTKAG